jgi:uncharacterized protein (TIGR02117 family)
VKRALRALGYLALGIAGVVCLYLAGGAAGGLIGTRQADAGGPVRVGLLIGPIHADILLPLTPAVRDRLAFASQDGFPADDPRAEWLIVGWGAQDFYTTTGTMADISAATALRAATGDRSVLRLDVTGRIDSFDGVALIAMDEATLLRLTDRILAEVPARADPLDTPGFSDTDVFYPASGPFNILRTCNVWVGQVLRDAGVSWGIWTPTPQAVRLSLWRFHPGAWGDGQAAAGASSSISATSGITRSP